MSKKETPKVDKSSNEPRSITVIKTGDLQNSVPRFEKAPPPPPPPKEKK
jgi:hypothetical protein